jgi:hypothetical protein
MTDEPDDDTAARDCCEDCYNQHGKCLEAAGSSTAAQAACNVQLRKCTETCPSGC